MNQKINYPRLMVKALLLFLAFGLVLVPILSSSIGTISLYNWLLPGRERLPFSDTPQKAYNLSLFNLEAMFGSHQVSATPDPEDEVRVFILGDSSTWGTLLKPEDTLAGQLDQMALTDSQGRPLRFYNLGYPTLSLTKDLLLLQETLPYDPDLIIWLVTLESFPVDKQLISPLVENNPQAIRSLFENYDLELTNYKTGGLEISYWDRTLFRQRRNLADIIRLQLYGFMWAITGIDQYYPETYKEAARDLSDDVTFHNWQEGQMTEEQLALEMLSAGKEAAGQIPLILINEPILISQGTNSDLRYNFYYPRWAYDDYRLLLEQFSKVHDLAYLDYWDLVPSEEFTNTAIHTTPQGVKLLAEELVPHIEALLHP